MNKTLVYGVHTIEALIADQPHLIEQLWVDVQASHGRLKPIVSAAQKHQLSINMVERSQLEEMSGGVCHQGVVAACHDKVALDEDIFLQQAEATVSENPLILVLDGVQDPHNLGACIRSAEAAGVSAIVIPKDKAASLTPTVHKVSSGASWRVPMVTATNLVRLLKKLQQLGYWSIGLDRVADTSIYEVDFTMPSILIMGAEHQGLRRLTKQHCDYLAHIPMQGGIESLNVSVAAGICLFEAQRQRIIS